MFDVSQDSGFGRSVSMGELFGAEGDHERPAMLFGELWFEGEIAMLVGDAGAGKSVLAMQIAEFVARSWPIEPFEMTAVGRRVLYVDLEMTGEQVKARYTSDRVRPGDRGFRYEFSGNLRYLNINACEMMSERDAEKTAEALLGRIGREVREHDIDVLIVDGITAMKRSYYGSTELMPVMRRLKRMMLEQRLSVLVTADVPRGDRLRQFTLRSLGGLRLAANIADSIIGLAHGGDATDERYLKHLRSRSSEIVFDETHLPLFMLCKNEGAFLGFEFVEYTSEPAELVDGRHESEADMVRFVCQEVRGKGRSIRAVAAQLGRSKSTIHRLAKLHEPLPGHEGYEEKKASSPPADDEKITEPDRPETDAGESAATAGDLAQGRRYSFRVHPRARRVGVADGGITAAPT